MALVLALIAIASGAMVTYFYDDDAPLVARVCAGACTGFAALGLIGFIMASFLGLTPLAVILAAGLISSPLALLLKPEWGARARFDMENAASHVRHKIKRPDSRTIIHLTFYALVALLLWLVFGRAMFERAGGIYTGVDNNLGDLPFHLSIITSFAYGQNFPPEHTEFAGARLTYPFLVDFVTAMFVRAGASVSGAFFWENYTLALALVGLLHRWALKLTRNWLAALITPTLILFSGGFGWWLLLHDVNTSGHDLFTLLQRLPHDYTITSDGIYRWGNALTTLLIPQRGLLFGLPLAIIVWTLWWQVTEEEGKTKTVKGKEEGKRQKVKGKRGKAKGEAETVKVSPSELSPFPFLLLPSAKRMIAAGIVAGLLPLVHAHSFVVLMVMGACLALLFPQWRAWAIFFAASLIIAAPQMLWATQGSSVRAGSFFGWQLGWDHGQQNIVWFWINNTGLFIPLLIVAVLWHGREPVVPRRLLLFYLPFTLCFIAPNFSKLSPWVWDNIKVIFYWYVASTPLVALLLARLWRERNALWRAMSLSLFITLTLAGGLDVWRVLTEASEQSEFDRDGVAFAELIKRETPARSLILNAPTYNHPVFLTGRRSLMGYPGHLWSQGMDYSTRGDDIQRMYAGTPGANELLARYRVEYVIISPLESGAMPVNEKFFEHFPKIGEVGAYRLYKTARP